MTRTGALSAVGLLLLAGGGAVVYRRRHHLRTASQEAPPPPAAAGEPPVPTGEPPRTRVDLSDLHPAFRAQVEAILADMVAKGWSPKVFEARRSPERADWLQANGRSKIGRKSYHVRAAGRVVAVDIIDATHGWSSNAFFDDLEAAANSHGAQTGNRWTWRDAAHVQNPSLDGASNA